MVTWKRKTYQGIELHELWIFGSDFGIYDTSPFYLCILGFNFVTLSVLRKVRHIFLIIEICKTYQKR